MVAVRKSNLVKSSLQDVGSPPERSYSILNGPGQNGELSLRLAHANTPQGVVGSPTWMVDPEGQVQKVQSAGKGTPNTGQTGHPKKIQQ